MKLYGLIGKKLSHSFSKEYFNKKFQSEGLPDYNYELFELSQIEKLRDLIDNYPHLMGLNVTIPYKQEVTQYLDFIDEAAKQIGAVNTIRIDNKKLEGFNTDTYGFERSLYESVGNVNQKRALVLGTGGASKAVTYILAKNKIPYMLIGRSTETNYDSLQQNPQIVANHNLIINTTPLGMYPDEGSKPSLPYSRITSNHILFDLVYNPDKTPFLKEGESRGAKAINGLGMLHYQAERAWQIWNYNI